MREDRARELSDPGLACVEVAAERVAAGMLEVSLGAPEELLMLHLPFPEAEERAQVRTVAVPIVLDGASEMDRDELLEVAEQVHVAEGATVVQRELLCVIEEIERLRAYPRCGHDGPRWLEAPVAK